VPAVIVIGDAFQSYRHRRRRSGGRESATRGLQRERTKVKTQMSRRSVDLSGTAYETSDGAIVSRIFSTEQLFPTGNGRRVRRARENGAIPGVYRAVVTTVVHARR